jgi:hypothetical protein
MILVLPFEQGWYLGPRTAAITFGLKLDQDHEYLGPSPWTMNKDQMFGWAQVLVSRPLRPA